MTVAEKIDALVAEAEATLPPDAIVDFIVKLDAAIGQWPVTDRLVEHFSALGKVHDIERSLDVANSERPGLLADHNETRTRFS